MKTSACFPVGWICGACSSGSSSDEFEAAAAMRLCAREHECWRYSHRFEHKDPIFVSPG